MSISMTCRMCLVLGRERTDGFERQTAMACRSSIDPRSDVTDDGSAYLALVANDPPSAALALGSDDRATQ